jgi:hypothetical protein
VTRSRTRLASVPVLLAVGLGCLLLPTPQPAAAGWGSGKGNPPSQTQPVSETVTSDSGQCRIYGSSSGFGLLCSAAGRGRTLAKMFRDAGIQLDGNSTFCWHDPDLPDGFRPDRPTSGPGQWWLQTCLSFPQGAIARANATLRYEYVFLAPGDADVLTGQQASVVARATGRGQMPFLQVQTSPVSSPRVAQDVAFSMLCDDGVQCSDTPAGRVISTPRLTVGGVTMHAELVGLRVLPMGAGRPDEEITCTGGGLPRTAAELDQGAEDDPRVCRYRFDRSSNSAGAGLRGDRYPTQVTAYWQIWFDDGSGAEPLGDPFEKTTITSIRVTEVQTLVVS